jgi:hypothetical protein
LLAELSEVLVDALEVLSEGFCDDLVSEEPFLRE